MKHSVHVLRHGHGGSALDDCRFGEAGDGTAPNLDADVAYRRGMKGAETISAIGQDGKALVLEVANHCLVGDLLERGPELRSVL